MTSSAASSSLLYPVSSKITLDPNLSNLQNLLKAGFGLLWLSEKERNQHLPTNNNNSNKSNAIPSLQQSLVQQETHDKVIKQWVLNLVSNETKDELGVIVACEVMWIWISTIGGKDSYYPYKLRHDYINDASDFLKSALIAHYSDSDKIRFLLGKDMGLNEIYCAFEVANVPFPRGAELQKAIRKLRGDVIDIALQFMSSPVVADQSIEKRLKFLRDDKKLTMDEIDEVKEKYLMKKDEEKGVHANPIGPAPVPINQQQQEPQTTPPPPPPPNAFATNFDKQNVMKAVSFLSNPSAQTQPLEARVAFLKKQKLSDADIQEALRLYALSATKPNASLSKNNSSSSTSAALLWSTDVVRTVLNRLTQQQSNNNNPRVLAALLVVTLCLLRQWKHLIREDELLLGGPSQKVASTFSQLESACLSSRTNSLLGLKYGEGKGVFEAYVAENLELCTIFSDKVDFYFERAFDTCKADGDVLESGLLLARSMHGSFCSRASVIDYYAATNVVLNKMLKFENAVFDLFVLVGLLRGGIDYCFGFYSKFKQLEIIRNLTSAIKQAIERNPIKNDKTVTCALGLVLVYGLQENLSYDESTRFYIEELMFEGCLNANFDYSQANEDLALAQCSKIVESNVCKLAATIANCLNQNVLASNGGKKGDQAMIAKCYSHAKFVYNVTRKNLFLSRVIGKRLIERAYDGKLSQASYEDSLGIHACFAKFFHLHFLVTVALLEENLTLQNSTRREVLQSWSCLCHLGFAMIVIPESYNLQQLILSLLKFDEKPTREEKNDSTTITFLSLMESDSCEDLDDFIYGAKLEYLLDTGGELCILSDWLSFCEKPVSGEGLEFGNHITFGSAHSFEPLHRRIIGSYMQKGVTQACLQCDDFQSRLDLNLGIELIPKFFSTMVQFKNSSFLSKFAFAVGFTFNALGKCVDERAQFIAVDAFKTFLSKEKSISLHSLCFISLKIVGLPSLPACCECIVALIAKLSFQEMKEASEPNGKAFSMDVLKNLKDSISRMDDSHRQSTLMLWFIETFPQFFESPPPLSRM